MSKLNVLVIVACGFDGGKDGDGTRLCYTTLARINAALDYAVDLEENGDRWLISLGGKVPHHIGGPTLAELKKELLSRDIQQERILTVDGVGTFSEAENACKLYGKANAENSPRVIVFSSNWYFWSGEKIWRHFARRYNIHDIHFHRSYTEAGRKTQLIYAGYATAVRIASYAGAMDWLGRRLTAWQSKRKNGYPSSGCD